MFDLPRSATARPLVALALALVAALSVAADSPEHASEPSPPGLAAHIHPVSLGENGRLAGPGGALLTERAAEAHFLLVGEQHAAGDLVRAITGLYRSVAPLGYDAVAIETSPVVAALLEDRLTGEEEDGLAGFFRDESPHLFTVPFYSWREEGDFLRAVTAHHKGHGPALWGLDQEFIAGGPLLADALDAWATTEAQKQAVSATREAAAANVMWLAFAADEDLDRLAEAFADGPGEARELIELIRVSRRIYRPFTGQGGSAYLANRERENLMKTHFLRYFEAAEAARGKPPKVFVKLGANHVYRGMGYTHVLSLGSFVEDLGVSRGLETFYLRVDCLGGEVRAVQGHAAPCESSLLQDDTALVPHLPESGWAVVDLASLRIDSKLVRELGEGWEDALWAFDALLVVRDPKPATFYEGAMPELPF